MRYGKKLEHKTKLLTLQINRTEQINNIWQMRDQQ